MIKKILRPFIHMVIFILLTLISQVGGVIYLLCGYLTWRWELNKTKSLISFSIIYLITTVLIIPFLAPLFGRTALPITGILRPLNLVTCLLNRHYVSEDLKVVLISAAIKINDEFPGTKTNYLDANFPFFNGFSLFPHLSHNDGKKIDIAFYYKDSDTKKITNSAPSFIGYGVYEEPLNYEVNFPEKCAKEGFWQYGALTYLIPKWKTDKFDLDQERTRKFIKILSNSGITSKIFIEPHLKQRWNLTKYNKIRFHGCHAVRHDDHIHWQVR